jgi:hypothetical protein
MSDDGKWAKLKAALAAKLRKAHDGQTPGEWYRPPPVYHNLYGRGAEDNQINALTRQPLGTWTSRSK